MVNDGQWQHANAIGGGGPPAPAQVRIRLVQLEGKRDVIQGNRAVKAADLEKVTAYLGIADSVDEALDKLSEQLFGRIIKILEEKLSD